MKALVLFSAGQDSTTCLAWALTRFDEVETIGFDYGQRHAIEMTQRPIVLAAIRKAFPEWATKLGGDIVVDLQGFGALSKSALTADVAIEEPKGKLPTTFVPGRNLLFLTAAAARGYLTKAYDLVGGMCETDFSGYPDCRRDTMDAMERSLSVGMDSSFTIHTPLMHLTKAETWALARELGGDGLVNLIREETHTCYAGNRSRNHDWGFGCGTCPACVLRAKGWEGYVQAAR